MSALAVRDFMANTVLNTVFPFPSQVTIWTAWDTFRQMPKLEKMGAKAFTVVSSPLDEDEHRIAGARGPTGTKEIVWRIPVLIYAEAAKADNGGDQFDILIWQCIKAFRTGPTGVTLTDPLTGEQSVLFKIGENIRGKGVIPRLIRQLQWVRFAHVLNVEVKEWMAG
jgi:hypothetical protein